MRTLRAFLMRLAGLRPSAHRDQDLSDEIEANLQLHIDDNLKLGMTPQQALL